MPLLLKSTRLFLDTLWNRGAIQIDMEKKFKLSLHDKNPRAPLSPIYINLRGKSHPTKPGPLEDSDIHSMALDILNALIKHKIEFDAVAGIPNAGTPFAHIICNERESRLRQPTRLVHLLKRSEGKPGNAKEREVTRQLRLGRGEAHANAQIRPRVAVVDDLITSSTMKWEAIRTLRSGNFEPVVVGVWLDREQGGSHALAMSGMRVVSVLTLKKMLEHYRDSGKINGDEYQAINQYLYSARS